MLSTTTLNYVNAAGHPHTNVFTKLLVKTTWRIIDEEYYRGAVLHREHAPALIKRNAQGVVVVEEWWLAGVRHRAEHPAVYQYDGAGHLISEQWFQHGVRTRQGGPAVITRYWVDQVPIRREEWYVDGIRQRKSGLVVLETAEGSNITTLEQWMQQGKLHREHAPAIIQRALDGTVVFSAWFHNGALQETETATEDKLTDMPLLAVF